MKSSLKNSKSLATLASTASFAHTYGITRGNKQKAFGLNPNLNIQDEYIQNLLKQVNFLNMEIRLLKQKQNEDKKLGIMGLLDRDQQPLVSHAVQSNMKFQTMKGNLQSKVSDLQASTLLLQDENTALFAQKQFLEKELSNQQFKLQTIKNQTGKQLKDLTDRVSTFRSRLFDAKEINNKIHKAFNNQSQEHDKLINSDKIQKLLKSVDTNLKKEQNDSNQKELTYKQETTKSNKAHWESVSGEFKTDPRYLQFIEENGKIKEKLRIIDKQVFNLSYKTKQYQELKNLSQRNIIIEKELAQDASKELQKLTEILKIKKQDFDRRIVERKRLTDLEPQTKKLQCLVESVDKQVDDAKKKSDIVQGVYKRYRQEILILQKEYQSIKTLNKQLQEKQKTLLPQVNHMQSTYNQASVELYTRQKQLQQGNDKYYNSKNKLLKLQQQLSYLSAKQQFFEKTLNLNQELNSLRLQQLRGISMNNSSVNQSIDQLLGKMDQMRKFAKDPMVISNHS